MRSSNFFLVVAAVAIGMFSASISQAQVSIDKNRSYFSPDQQFGFGVNNAGLHVQYALGPAFHLGLNLNMDFTSAQSTSEQAYNFGPYAKFLFSGDVIKPYAYAAVGVIQPNSGKFQVLKNGGEGSGLDINADLPKTEVRTYLAFGGEHFFNQNVGMYGQVNLLDAKLSPNPSVVNVGLRGGVVGVEFFF
jgi:hypothetical protein